TDAVAVEGLEAAFERAERYLECGVDAIFIEALRSPGQLDAACARFASRVPLLANMVEGGQTPVESADALEARGFRIVIFPGGTARAVAHTLQNYYGSLRQQGTTAPWRDRMLIFDRLTALLGHPGLQGDAGGHAWYRASGGGLGPLAGCDGGRVAAGQPAREHRRTRQAQHSHGRNGCAQRHQRGHGRRNHRPQAAARV